MRFVSKPDVIFRLYAGPEVDVWSCGIILYALLCGTLPFDDEHVPTLFRKIKSGVFPIPDYLEKSAVNLVVHMLQVDPIKRATIKDVIAHEWFKIDLPTYLFPPPNEQEASIVDVDAVKELCSRIGCQEEDVTLALLSNDPHNHLVIAYNLIIDNKRFASETAKMALDEFYTPNMTPGSADDHSPARHPERMEIAKGLTPTLDAVNLSLSAIPANQTTTVRQSPHVRRAKWHLGIRSQSRAEDIMYEVFRAMKSLNFEWKIVTPYHVIVRSRNNDVTPKMSLQLYEVDQRSYLLDFKSLADDLFDSPTLEPQSSLNLSVNSSSNGRSFVSSSSMMIDVEDSRPTVISQGPQQSQTMLFFEMCASLIASLAR
ncbi:5' AMP activated protein kinase catalytic [Trichuris trichiura]|uniref:non-specific serine/threonine protein kinase n=1 Tax=Trichuris trichiura TaxID=36087 RepID=A0A077ZJM0_TRITR|nr:5' AMP activated protein kinase catalytic [Trichuris trichiura]